MSALTLALALGAAGCRRKAAAAGAEPVQTLHDLTMTQSDRGRPAWRLFSTTARLTEQDHQASLDEPRMSFYQDGKITTKLSAVSGLVQTQTQDVTLSTDVIVRSLSDGSTLTTSRLDYSSQRQKFHTDEPVVVRRPGSVVHGIGMEANRDLSEIRIFHQHAVTSGSRPPS